MLSLKGKNNGFSSIYKILTNQKIYKIYNKTKPIPIDKNLEPNQMPGGITIK